MIIGLNEKPGGFFGRCKRRGTVLCSRTSPEC